ncbi:hypothetical protein COO04_09950 [Bacillus toyonensis]|uniref:hypothetical protein n=1 Tax=Bacillus cereus group TaxID=86661 RepID=UPI000BEBF72A|nr:MULTISPECIES: hypothetical protein [Bacillus cereus group]MBJ7931853.1 hypothetical protein [Bacillus cereus group sp. N31]PEG16359.1 hypothetical protein COO04_09950 [Bacillus toyonensis]
MGTSKGYAPPTGYLWSDAKRAVSYMGRNNFTPSSVGKAISKYSQALKGMKNSSNNINIGGTGAKAINFIDLVKNYGFTTALENIGLKHLIDKKPDEIYVGLTEYFAGSKNSLLEGIAQQSINELMAEILADVQTLEEYDEIFLSINKEEFIREFIIKFVQNSFFTTFSEKIISMFDNLNQFDGVQDTIETYIRTTIENDYTLEELQHIDWAGEQGSKIIDQKCDGALQILTVWSESLV